MMVDNESIQCSEGRHGQCDGCVCACHAYLPEKQPKNSHLKQFEYKPGESGNPGGRPAGKSITAELRKLLDDGTEAEDIAKALLKLAKDTSFKGNVAALKELIDRTDGKVTDTHRIEGDIPVSIVYKQVKRDD